ncbi:MAG: hypothetical protein AAF713_02405 [Pseudomonadota bacterium]
MSAPDDEGMVRGATCILLRLNQDPGSQPLLRSRDEFLARGAVECAACDELLGAWKLTGCRRRPRTLCVVVLPAALAASLYVAAGLGNAYFLADFGTATTRMQVILALGNRVGMGAGSALTD